MTVAATKFAAVALVAVGIAWGVQIVLGSLSTVASALAV